MKRLASAGLVAAIVLSSLPANAQTRYSCGMGTLRGVEIAFETVPADSAEFGGLPFSLRNLPIDVLDSPETFDLTPRETESRIFLVTVQLGDTTFTSRASERSPGNLDPTRLPIDGSFSICVNKTQMILDPMDGRDYRAKIVRAVRGERTITNAP